MDTGGVWSMPSLLILAAAGTAAFLLEAELFLLGASWEVVE